MGQKSIESFFAKTVGKRSVATASAAGSGGGAVEPQQARALPPLPQQEQEQQAQQAQAQQQEQAQQLDQQQQGDGGSATPAAAPGPAPGASPLQTAVQQVSEQQRFRALANKNQALAKQVVVAAERAGGLPRLGDLLTEPSWRALLEGEMGGGYFQDLEAFVRGEWAGGQLVFPLKDCIFRALNSVPVGRVKVVILGQDPYHDLGQAMGLSFSVPEGKAVPSSLRNMYKELQADCGCPPGRHGNLEKWAQQGVLLLNAVLTVRAHAAASHAKRGWEAFTDAAIARLSAERRGVVFLLWGRYAQDKGKHIDKSRHHVLTAAHPSGLSAHRGFFGCRHFSKANALLQQEGQVPIDWCIE